MTGQEDFFLKLVLKVHLDIEIYFRCMFLTEVGETYHIWI